MQWRKTISLGNTLSDVVLISQTREATAGRDQQREQAAYERGLADGETRLNEKFLRQRTEMVELQNGVLGALKRALPEVVRQSEAGMIDLALEVARKLVSDLPISVEMVTAAIHSALAQAQESTEFHISLHSTDLALLQQCHSPMLVPSPENNSMHFEASEEVSPGGCLVRTRFGVIDARRETKLKLIAEALNS